VAELEIGKEEDKIEEPGILGVFTPHAAVSGLDMLAGR